MKTALPICIILICLSVASGYFFPPKIDMKTSFVTLPDDHFVPTVPFTEVPPDVDEFPEGEPLPTPAEIEGSWVLRDRGNTNASRKAAVAALPWKVLNLRRTSEENSPTLTVATLDPNLDYYAMAMAAEKIVVTLIKGDKDMVNVSILYDKSQVYIAPMRLVSMTKGPKAEQSKDQPRHGDKPSPPKPKVKKLESRGSETVTA